MASLLMLPGGLRIESARFSAQENPPAGGGSPCGENGAPWGPGQEVPERNGLNDMNLIIVI